MRSTLFLLLLLASVVAKAKSSFHFSPHRETTLSLSDHQGRFLLTRSFFDDEKAIHVKSSIRKKDRFPKGLIIPVDNERVVCSSNKEARFGLRSSALFVFQWPGGIGFALILIQLFS